jgi:hypothetical protein
MHIPLNISSSSATTPARDEKGEDASGTSYDCEVFHHSKPPKKPFQSREHGKRNARMY